MTNILIVTPNTDEYSRLSAAATASKMHCVAAETLAEATRQLGESTFDAVLLSTRLPDGDGLDLLINEKIGETTQALVLNDTDDVQLVARCMRLGADDYLQTPLNDEQISAMFERIARQTTDHERTSSNDSGSKNRKAAPASAGDAVESSDGYGRLLGTSRPMLKLYRMLERVAQTDVPVMLVGESGTGKERAAASIHLGSPRAEGPFIPVNCSAIPRDLTESQFFGHLKGAFTDATASHDGFFRQADGGTLFLDELTEMDINLQAKLLRALESGRIRPVGGSEEIAVDIRIIAATNRSPEQAIEEGLLREDLYYRLAAFPIHMPPLRNRGSDVTMLAEHFLKELAAEHGRSVTLSEEAADCLRLHDWPGNVRELRNAITRAFIMSDDEIDAASLPEAILEPNHPAGDLLRIRVGESIADAEKKLILATLEYHDQDRTRSARELGISVKTLYNRMKSYEQAGADTSA